MKGRLFSCEKKGKPKNALKNGDGMNEFVRATQAAKSKILHV